MTLQTLAIPPTAAPAAVVPDGVTMLRAWASAASEAAQLVAPLVDTPFVPDAFRPKVDPRASAEEKTAAREIAVASATAAVLYGAGLGLDPMTSLQNIYVVGGRPGLYAAAMVALAQAHGHEVQTEDLTDTRAVVRARRRGTDHWERVVFTLDQAKKAGYTRNAKYQSDPQAMLYARAASIAIRRIAQDTLKGIAAVEELQDDDARGSSNGTRTVQRASVRVLEPAPAEPILQQQAAPAAPPVPGDTASAAWPQEGARWPQPDGSGQPLDESTWRKINARFVQLGRSVNGPGQQNARLYVIGRIVERVVEKGSDLTAAEGEVVLGTLQGTTAERVAALLAERNRVEPGQGAAVPEMAGPPLPGEDDDTSETKTPPVTSGEAEDAQHNAQTDVERADPPVDPWGIEPTGGQS